MDGLEMKWRELRDRILEAHRPIQHLFFEEIGNKFQYTDICIAESVMLQFPDLNRMTRPIHDSFILSHLLRAPEASSALHFPLFTYLKINILHQTWRWLTPWQS